jgi:hypothetical protein
VATRVTSADRFEIDYANGKIEFAQSVQQAELKIAIAARDLHVQGLLPATIRSRVPEVIGVGEVVMTVNAQDVESIESRGAEL